ncbi:MAG: YbgC/FadM family acyl-CoA thioesterase, partial [Caldimonas sp.]
RLRVRWAEIDAQKIVFNGHYLMYFDTAVAGYWRALGVPYAQTMLALDGDLFVRKAELEYLASARYDDVLDIGLRCARVGTSSATFVGGAFRDQQLLVSCTLTYVFADPHGSASKPVPRELRELFDRFEAGQPMVEVRVGPWGELGQDARAIRTEVFIAEQKIPAEMEWDDADDSATHAVAYNRLGRALATGRMLEHVPGVAKIGRMAVLASSRHSGVGRAVLDGLLDAARGRGEREAVLHAQLSAAPFYQRAGFVRRGPEFDEAGIAHIEMLRTL